MTAGKYSNSVNLFTFRINDKALREKIRNAKGHYQQANRAVERANQASVAWLGERAAKNLEAHTRRGRARDDRNPVPLAAIVRNPEASHATADGFQFLIQEKVAALSARAAAYYRVIEVGSSYWVGKRHVLVFYGPSGPAGQAAYGLRPTARAGRNLPTVLIRRPVPAYHYLDDARESFIKGRLSGRFINAELRSEGIAVTSKA